MSKRAFLIVAALTAWATAATAVTPPPSPAASGPAQSRDGMNRRVRIHNQTGWTMTGFQVAEARSRAWQDDLIAARPVTTGASWVATVDDGSGACVYVFRAEFANGQTLERTPINVCEIADYYFTR